MPQFQVGIIGGGIVGLATAYQLLQARPGTRVLVVEKESAVAQHQTGHNSGVLHSGIYYRPGTLRAANCRAGKQAMVTFCREQGIPHEICGKVIVAVDEREIPLLEGLYERGQKNGVACRLIDRAELADLEPHVAGQRAIHVAETGIVDYRQVAARLAKLIQERGAEIVTTARVLRLIPETRSAVICTTRGDFSAEYLVNCAGLHSDRVARLAGRPPDAKIVPFRGEYYELRPSAHRLCRNLIYPVPDPNFPFLGVHFTRSAHGTVECGPNAVLALAREGYRKWDFSLRDSLDTLSYPGFLRLAARHWRAGLGELRRSFSKRAFVAALQRMIPEIRSEDLQAAPAGVRAQAVSRTGALVDDFLIVGEGRVINVCNAPSPAATASLNIGQIIVAELTSRW